MATFKIFKALAALPGSLEANAAYAVRVGTGFDLYITDETGLIAYQINSSSGGGGLVKAVVDLDFGTGASTVTQEFPWNGAAVGATVLAAVSLDMPAGVSEDELEMDALVVAARISSANVVRVMASTASGFCITGQRRINLLLG